MQYVDRLNQPGFMPVTTPPKPVEVKVGVNTKEWKVLETIRNNFATTVMGEDKQPKINAKGEQQVRRVSGGDVVNRLLTTLLLDAPPETLEALAAVAKDKLNAKKELPAFKTSDFIRSIVTARAAAADSTTSKVDAKAMSAEERAALRRELDEADKLEAAAKQPGKGTKDVAAV